MALKIRLSRAGSKKRPVYRVVVADSRSPRDGRFIEKVGLYNPLLQKDNKDRIQLNLESIKEWISKGAKPTDKVARFLGEAGVIPMPAQGNNPKKAQPKKKAQERLAAAEEAKNQPTPEAPAEDTPAKEAPAQHILMPHHKSFPLTMFQQQKQKLMKLQQKRRKKTKLINYVPIDSYWRSKSSSRFKGSFQDYIIYRNARRCI